MAKQKPIVKQLSKPNKGKNTKNSKPRYIIIKPLKAKEKNLKKAEKKKTPYLQGKKELEDNTDSS